ILRGEFTLVSTNTDVSQLMEMTNGLGSSEKDSMAVASGGPYMVPSNMDMLLHSRIGCATMGSNMMHDFKGDVRVCNGLLVLDDLTFSLSDADMQLTAMYRTPRKNHLYAGFDFHIPNVEIDKMLEMVPDLDSIMPMLRSFRGEGELHIAAETYMDSLYNIKMSTLRGASFVKGKNLVLMDGETFDKIAKTLKFNKQAANKVDSLSVEFTIFRNEIDVYPFLIVMDKYKAIIGGRHNLDMSFDYNITVVESPLPFRLALDAKGTLDDLKIRLAKSKYPEMYRPVVRKEVEKRRLELRSLIRNSLIEKIH
ncbi:MAG: hypothetical protein LBV64_01335, partial [Mediterranea sp.]|nr:hypothetical protein [Mediterranea sp.]